MNKQAYMHTLSEQWDEVKDAGMLKVLRQGLQADATLAEVLAFLKQCATAKFLASTRVIDLVKPEPAHTTAFAAPPPRARSTPRSSRANSITPGQVAALESAILELLGRRGHVTTAQVVAELGNRSNVNKFTLSNRLHDMHRRGLIAKHPEQRATWMAKPKVSNAVAPIIIRHGQEQRTPLEQTVADSAKVDQDSHEGMLARMTQQLKDFTAHRS